MVWELHRPSVSHGLPTIDNSQDVTASEEQREANKRRQIQLLYAMLVAPHTLNSLLNDGMDEDEDLQTPPQNDEDCDPDTKQIADTMKYILELKSATEVDSFYHEVCKRIPDSNGMVTEDSPLLSKLIGCHNAALLLGSSEQGMLECGFQCLSTSHIQDTHKT